MKLVSILFFLFIAGKAYSQNYVITHDLQKERTQYLKIDKHNDTVKVKDINIKKNGRIILQVNNYNPFYWSARVTTYKKPVDNQASSGGTFNPFSFLAQGFGNFISSAMPKLDMPKANSDTYNSQGMKDAVSTVYLYKRNYEQLVQLQNQLNEMENLRLKLISLKYDIIKDEATIKAEAAQSVSKVLGTTQLEFEDVYAMGNRLDNVLQNTVDSSILLQSMIAKQQSSLNQQIAEPSVTVRGANGKMLPIQKFNEENPHVFLEKINNIASMYREISNAIFKYSYVVNADPEISDLKLELFSRVDSMRKDTIVKYFSVSGKGNFKLRNSMGIAFTYFADNNRSYFVDPGTNKIVRSNADFFTPVLSTFIHFYGGGNERLKWGGALGFGIPLQGAQKDINFMLGLSAVFGKNEPILISAGVSGGKVNKLDKGYKTGDAVSSGFVIPTRSVYQPGLFIAVTFNLSSINRKN